MKFADGIEDENESKMARYLAVSKLGSAFNENEWLFAGKELKFRIIDIIESATMKGHKAEIAVLQKLQKWLQNKSAKWTDRDLMILQEYCTSDDSKCVLY